MRRAAIFICIVAGVTAVRAQTPPRAGAQSVAPPAGTCVLAGVVKDHDGTPVRRATVSIEGDMHLDRMTVADDQGRFSFVNLPGGRFTVTAEKAGYPRTSYGAKRPFRAGSGVLLQEGQQVRDLVLTLARGAALTGTVYDQRGDPMPGVPVMAWEIRTSLGGARTLDYGASGPDTVITDDRGVYRVYGLAPGDYTIGTSWYFSGIGYDVRVLTDAEIRAAFEARNSSAGSTSPPPPRDAAAVHHNYSPVFSPGVLDPLAAATFTLAPGEERAGADLHMQFQPVSHIEGTIVTPDGSPVSGELIISRRSSVEALNTMSVRPGQSEARFSSETLSPGPYSVMFEGPGRAGTPPLWAVVDVIVSGDQPVMVTLVLQPALTASGRIVFDGTSIPPPADLSQVAISLRALGPVRPSTDTKIDASGSFSITGVIPGQYRVAGSAPAGATAAAPAWTVRSVVVDGRDVTDRPFEIGAGGASGLVVTFTDLVSELSGTLTTPSGAPATDYFVIAIPADRAYWIPGSRRIVSTRPDRAGRYVFNRLPAGDYRIALTADLVPDDLRDMGAIERLAAVSAPVAIKTGEHKTLDLRTNGGSNAQR